MERRFEFVGGTSRKYWIVGKPGQAKNNDCYTVVVHFGRIGTAGQWHTKVLSSKGQAEQYYENKILEKLDKGYTETTVMNTGHALETLKKQIGTALSPAAVKALSVKAPPVKLKCAHGTVHLKRPGVWECLCGHTVDLTAVPMKVASPAIVQAYVTRFMETEVD